MKTVAAPSPFFYLFPPAALKEVKEGAKLPLSKFSLPFKNLRYKES